jgi:outer membrane protein assembly factor BamB
MRHLRWATAAAVALVATGCTWAGVRNDATRSGAQPGESAISPGNVATLRPDWTVHPVELRANDTFVEEVAVRAGRVYAATGTAMHVLDAGTGAEIWQYAGQVGPTFDTSVTPPAVADSADGHGTVFVGQSWLSKQSPGLVNGQFVALDATDQTTRWSVSQGAGTFFAPLFTGDAVVIDRHFPVPTLPTLAVLDPATGATRFSVVGNVTGAAASADGMVYAPRGDGKVAAIALSGCGQSLCEPQWLASDGSGAIRSVAVADGTLFVIAPGGSVTAFPAAGCGAATCTPSWSTGATAASGIAVTGGRLYVTENTGTMRAYSSTGCGAAVCAPLWMGTSSSSGLSAPSVANGVVYAGSYDSHVYAWPATGCGQSSCSPIWSSPLTGIGRAPSIANGHVYVPSGYNLRSYGLPPSG